MHIPQITNLFDTAAHYDLGRQRFIRKAFEVFNARPYRWINLKIRTHCIGGPDQRVSQSSFPCAPNLPVRAMSITHCQLLVHIARLRLALLIPEFTTGYLIGKIIDSQ